MNLKEIHIRVHTDLKFLWSVTYKKNNKKKQEDDLPPLIFKFVL